MTKEQIQALLEESDRAVERAIVAIFNYQTYTEQQAEQTSENNGVGFNSVDAEFLSSLAKAVNKGYRLTQKQMVYGRKKIKKYWKQLQLIAENRG